MDLRSNPHGGTEENVGKLHKLLAVIHKMGLDALIEEVKANPDDVLYILDSKIVDRVHKFIEYNGVGMQLAEEGETELGQNLAKIRKAQGGKIVQFVDPDEVMTG